jgi:glycosyltransferase involved in cell wall biosynthesis
MTTTHSNPQGSAGDEPTAGIQRDAEYYRTLTRDNRKNRLKRMARQSGAALEALTSRPRWQKLSDDVAAGRRPRQKLSTCIITMNSQERIRPLLTYCRQFSDEIVVGVDSKTTDATYSACEGLADELFWIENDHLTCNAGLEALVNRCHGDWVLRLDDDEFPEPDWIRYHQGILASAGDVTHYKLPRLHIAELVDAAAGRMSWLDDGYLYPDYQMRLFRNDKALLSFPGAVGHASIGCSGPRGKLHGINLVHLNLAINPRFKREEKLGKYIRRLQGGWVHPINEHALLFEDFNYRIRDYRGGDERFRRLLAETTRHQAICYERERQNAISELASLG